MLPPPVGPPPDPVLIGEIRWSLHDTVLVYRLGSRALQFQLVGRFTVTVASEEEVGHLNEATVLLGVLHDILIGYVYTADEIISSPTGTSS